MIRRALFAAVFLMAGLAHAVEAQVPADLRAAMKARDQAASAKDAVTWDRLTHEDFTVVLDDGVLRTKAERLAHLKTQKPTAWAPPTQETVTVRGEVAIQRFRSRDTWDIVVWVKDAKGWRVIAAQDTPARK